MRCCLLLAAFSLPALLPTAGFAQWQLQNSNSTADLRGIDNVGGGVAWASGTHGTVLRTEDGGYIWQTCAVPPGAEKLDFRGVQAFDANTAIVMSSGPGDLSRLYKTTDGCHTWKLVFTNPDKDGFWDAIQFADERNGFLLGDPVKGRFVLFGTFDGGDKWIRADSVTLQVEGNNSGAFAASNSALLFTKTCDVPSFITGGPGGARYYGGLYQSTKNNKSGDSLCRPHIGLTPPSECLHSLLAFQVLTVPVIGDSSSSGGFSIAAAAFHAYREVVVGGDYTKPDNSSGTAAYLDQKFEGWLPSETPPHGYRSSVAYYQQEKLWITVGPNGTDISTDDGRNWRAVHPDPALHEAPDADRNWNALSLPFVVGPHGRMGRLEAAAVKGK